jgi:prevent-host-death family protein
MPRSRDVKPITYLKNSTAKLVREVTEHGRTVLITQNGEASVVVMDVAQYDRWRNAMALAKLLSLSAVQSAQGRVVSTAEALAKPERFPDRGRVVPELLVFGNHQVARAHCHAVPAGLPSRRPHGVR